MERRSLFRYLAKDAAEKVYPTLYQGSHIFRNSPFKRLRFGVHLLHSSLEFDLCHAVVLAVDAIINVRDDSVRSKIGTVPKMDLRRGLDAYFAFLRYDVR